jgi:hypothetical protein
MKRFLLIGLAALAVLATASLAPAATISDVVKKPWDPALYDVVAGFGSSLTAWYLTYEHYTQGYLFDPTARPTGNPSVGPDTNPSWLVFDYIQGPSPGGGGGGGGGTSSSGHTITMYDLGRNDDRAWDMDFSTLFYDPAFTGTGVTITFQGSKGGTKTFVLSKEEVTAGMLLTWTIGTDAKETVRLIIDAEGDATYAAGFFMQDNSGAPVPEPATLSLLAISAAGLILRRRKT